VYTLVAIGSVVGGVIGILRVKMQQHSILSGISNEMYCTNTVRKESDLRFFLPSYLAKYHFSASFTIMLCSEGRRR
jgi:carbonic anhydrase